jgi:adenylate cyclase
MMPVFDAVTRAYDRYLDASDRRLLSKAAARQDAIVEGIATPGASTLMHHFEIQDALRPLFGKGSSVEPCIGDHPDFEHLKRTRATEFAPITTLFLDMEGSTRLGLVYPPDRVFRIKNAVIQSTIDIIKSFDGHVHRIMGDAVMAYFGGKTVPAEQGAIDALNCAVTLRAMIGSLIDARLPELAAQQLGVRIGIDYGPREKVLWGPYGYPGMEEVTATSFHVDVASKLQHAAGRNQIMLGQSLRDFLDVPDVLLRKKTFIKDGEEQDEPYVTPNYAGADGKPVNYRQYVLNWEDYLECTDLGAVASNANHIRVAIGLAEDRREDLIVGAYHPCAAMVAKEKQLHFAIELPFQPRLPIALDLRVENHGREASKVDDHANHHTRLQKTALGDLSCSHWESTRYRGLHYLDVLVSAQGKQVMKRRLGVWVQ